MTTRAEHLKWCKDRAIEIVDGGDAPGGWASFSSDMNKHPETATHVALPLGTMMMFAGELDTREKMKKFINDFN